MRKYYAVIDTNVLGTIREKGIFVDAEPLEYDNEVYAFECK